jgi:hypothetical protein
LHVVYQTLFTARNQKLPISLGSKITARSAPPQFESFWYPLIDEGMPYALDDPLMGNSDLEQLPGVRR